MHHLLRWLCSQLDDVSFGTSRRAISERLQNLPGKNKLYVVLAISEQRTSDIRSQAVDALLAFRAPLRRIRATGVCTQRNRALLIGMFPSFAYG